MTERPDDPFPDSDLDQALEQAWGAKGKRGESVVARLERMPGVRSRVLLHEPLEEDAAPLLRVGAAEGPDRPTEDSRYQLVGEIARGGVGIIYRGRDRDLGRDVALKVLRTEHAHKDFVVTRFVEEAQIGAQLQHPGVVPVYSLGLQPDGRPHFAMKLVKGRTLGALLEARRDPVEDQRRFLGIFLQVCQTVSYAHARGVLHRDLKPANVMVGAFGEVLVVDWGFGKVLGRAERVSQAERAAKTVIATVRTGSEGSQSLVGSVMGTPAYMPPEQALGHVEELDARSDVFSLGAILCEVLTGKPPYLGELRDLLVQAAQARLDPALERLAACDADEDVKALARRCLQPVPGDRPADAGVVATALGDWMAAADERARRAEVEAVEEQARLEREQERAAWERRAKKKLRLGAVAAGLAIVLGAGALWLVDARRHERADAARPAVEQALLEAARLDGQGQLAGALGAAERARDLAQTGGVPADLQAQAVARVGELGAALEARRAEAQRAEEARAFVRELAEIHLSRWEGFDDRRGDREYERAFASRGLAPLTDPPGAFAEGLRRRHGDVLVEVASALDMWAALRWTHYEARAEPWQPLLACARALDPDAVRNRIRDGLVARDGEALAALAADESAVDLTGPTAYVLAIALRDLNGEEGLAQREALLQRRLLRRPDDFWAHAIWSFCEDPNDQDGLERALDHALAAVALRPDLARAQTHLANAYRRTGRFEQALAVAAEALRLAPDDATIWSNYGVALSAAGSWDEEEQAYRHALELDPEHALALCNLANRHNLRGRLEEARQAYEQALALRPDLASAHSGLGSTFIQMREHERGVACARAALRLDPKLAGAWSVLATGLGYRRAASEADLHESLAAARCGVELAPRGVHQHLALAQALARLGRAEEALAAARAALRLDPESAYAYAALGFAHEVREDHAPALDAFRKALALDPTLEEVPGRVGAALLNLNRVAEAERELRQQLDARRSASVLIMLSQALTAGGKLEDAQACLDELTDEERREHLRQLNFARAVLYEAREEFQEAEAAYRENVALRPRALVGRGRLAQLLRQLGRQEEAIALCREGLALSESMGLHLHLGIALSERWEMSDAQLHLEQALERAHLDSDRAVCHFNLALHNQFRGRPKEAIAHLEHVFELAEGDADLAQLVDRADGLMRDARKWVRLLPRLPGIVDGTERPDDAEEWRLAWNLCWARDERAAARKLHAEATPFMPQPTAWLAEHAGFCLRNCCASGLHHPIDVDERRALRREARGLLRRVVSALRDGVADAQQAREGLKLVRDEWSTRPVREAEQLALLSAEDRAAWTALWQAVDEVLGDEADGADDAEGR